MGDFYIRLVGFGIDAVDALLNDEAVFVSAQRNGPSGVRAALPKFLFLWRALFAEIVDVHDLAVGSTGPDGHEVRPLALWFDESGCVEKSIDALFGVLEERLAAVDDLDLLDQRAGAFDNAHLWIDSAPVKVRSHGYRAHKKANQEGCPSCRHVLLLG